MLLLILYSRIKTDAVADEQIDADSRGELEEQEGDADYRAELEDSLSDEDDLISPSRKKRPRVKGMCGLYNSISIHLLVTK